ncbi:putative glutathione S-transferase-like protein [Candidatus Rhodobacter oscarellae]|uniref:Putative glutathione S-transferase-like protein n=1 Tax=Candidatus Rhodobacter oscarellae TaxID=1675527 RepID=A0A0J9E0J3_9RHOB|nr:glutathione S-transferase family protein [Candidatus Rhodobacter lobularis]KMW56240.1 putative glutathione S-transferase-like protein [Candidatus Rhodobacter lobularis]
MLTVYGRATSSNVQLVMWAVGELGLAHRRLDYGHVFGGVDTPEYLALNPNGTVPTLKDGDLVVWESCAILRYLAGTYGDEAFWPRDPAARAAVDQWAEWGKINLTLGFTVPIFWARVRTAAKDRDQAALDRSLAQFERALDILEAQLAHQDYVASDRFTAADVVIGHVLYRWYDIDVPRRPRARLEEYYQRLSHRPAYRQHVMVDYSALRVEGA